VGSDKTGFRCPGTRPSPQFFSRVFPNPKNQIFSKNPILWPHPKTQPFVPRCPFFQNTPPFFILFTYILISFSGAGAQLPGPRNFHPPFYPPAENHPILYVGGGHLPPFKKPEIPLGPGKKQKKSKWGPTPNNHPPHQPTKLGQFLLLSGFCNCTKPTPLLVPRQNCSSVLRGIPLFPFLKKNSPHNPNRTEW